MNIEKLVFSNLVHNEVYARKVLPFLKSEYFSEKGDRVVFELFEKYFEKYNTCPTIEALAIELQNSSIDQQAFVVSTDTLHFVQENAVPADLDWIVDQTEKLCQEKAVYNAILASIAIIDDKSKIEGKGMIPKLLHDALAVSFDTHVGHDFMEDSNARYEYYHTKEAKIPFDLHYFNEITGGGLPKKTLNVILAGVNVGKSLAMCHMAATNLSQGKNVLYITLEMAEEEIAKRIDANLLDVTMDELVILPKESYDRKINRLRSKTLGKLIVKEYPTACAGSANFRYLIEELRVKKDFVPDIIYIDYLNICSSSRIKMSAAVNSYTLVKAIAEEIRGLAVEFKVPIVSATQVNRAGFADSDFGLENTSESFGLPATADLMFGLIRTEELDELNQILVKQLKNRYNGLHVNRRFVIGVDYSKMRLYDTEQSAQSNILEGPVMERTAFGQAEEERSKKFDRSSFEGFR